MTDPQELSLEQLRFVLALSEQIVSGVEQTFFTTGRRKKQLACLVLTDILQESGLYPTSSIVDIAIESSVQIMHIFEPHQER
jgi:hypothetical protein